MKRVLREPLLHFLLLGAVIFAVYGFVSARTSSSEPRSIVVSQGQVSSMVVGFSRTWQRPPTREELDAMIRDRVREEVYCREAVALGLDQDDTIIRRRLRQKMEFLTDDVLAQAEPTDEDLNTYLTDHPDAFRVEQRFTFRHVYFNPAKHTDSLESDAIRLLAQLNQDAGHVDISELGDPFLLEHSFSAVPGGELAKLFGDTFAARLVGLSTGQWQGPIESGYGVHLVLITERTVGRVPTLAEVRDAVSREWSNAQRQEANEKLYSELLGRYTVIVEPPAPGEKADAAAGGVR